MNVNKMKNLFTSSKLNSAANIAYVRLYDNNICTTHSFL